MTGMENTPVSFRVVEGKEQTVFSQYLLPVAAVLARKQRAHLYGHPQLPGFLHPSGRLGLDPDLSLVYLCDGEPEGIWLCASTAVGHYSLLGVWRSEAAPVFCFHEMILAHLNHCWYHGGGDFQYYVSPAVEFADKLIQKYTQGNYRRMEEHFVELWLEDKDDDCDEDDDYDEDETEG